MVEKQLFLACPTCGAPIEVESEGQTVVCVLCDTVAKCQPDPEENLELQPVKEKLTPETRQGLLDTLQAQLNHFQKTLDSKRARLDKVSKDMQYQAEREVALLPSLSKRNSNIVVISSLVLLAVLAANLVGTGGQLTSISIFTIVVFIGIMIWMLFMYFTGQREQRVSSIRRQYQQEFEQISQETSEEVEKLEKSVSLASRQIERLRSEQV